MENRYVLENSYKINYDSAKRFLAQNNILAAKEAFKKALAAAIELVKITTGTEQSQYRSNAILVGQMIEQINQKIAAEQNKGKAADNSKKEEAEAPVPEVSLEEALEQLDALEGLKIVKEQVKDFLDFKLYNKKQQQFGMPVNTMKSNHMVFMGNPGTGKTTVARIMAQILKAIGIVSKGQLVEVDRKDLVAGYVGQTAAKTKEIVDKAKGGVLFIDEAYTLDKGGNDFGQEAIDTLLKGMEDYRDDLVVIVAGYDDLMNKFIGSNPGLASRFPNYLNFNDYDGKELFNIFERMCHKGQYVLTNEAERLLRDYFNDYYENRGINFGNARDVRNIFEKMETLHAKRINILGDAVTREDITTITDKDLPFNK